MSEPCRRLKGGTMVTRSLTFGFLMLVAGCDGDSFDDEIESTQLASGTWPVTWVRTAGVAVNGNSLTKTGPIGWNAGARSFELAGSGYVEFTTAENNTAKMVGLSSDDTGTGYAEIAFAIRLKRNGRVSVFEQGVLQVEDMTTYLPGDVFRVEVEAAGFGIAVVTYSKNGVVFHSRAILSDELLDYPMFLVDTSLYTPGATINNVVLVSTQVTWQNTVNVGVFRTLGGLGNLEGSRRVGLERGRFEHRYDQRRRLRGVFSRPRERVSGGDGGAQQWRQRRRRRGHRLRHSAETQRQGGGLRERSP